MKANHKVSYPHDIAAVELEEQFGDIIFVFTYLGTQIVGTLFCRGW